MSGPGWYRHRRHLAFYAGLAAGVLVFAAGSVASSGSAVEMAAIAFFLVYLILTGFRVPSLSAAYLRDHALENDEPAPVILAVTFGAVALSLVSLFAVVNGAGRLGWPELVLAVASVALGWLTIHTMAALHYAHLYWRPSQEAADQEARGGLDFPGKDEPGAHDFLYFAFVIGMTAQTSDVAITSTAMRKANLLHAVVSFFFNTVLVAAAVNVAVSLAG